MFEPPPPDAFAVATLSGLLINNLSTLLFMWARARARAQQLPGGLALLTGWLAPRSLGASSRCLDPSAGQFLLAPLLQGDSAQRALLAW